LPLWIRPFLTTFWEPQLGQVGVDITVHGGLSYLYPYIWRTTQSFLDRALVQRQLLIVISQSNKQSLLRKRYHKL
jgi:hypothetical protein